MDVQSYEAGQDNKLKNKVDDESGGKRKGSPGKEVEVVWTSDEKRIRTMPLYEGGNGNESTGKKE